MAEEEEEEEAQRSPNDVFLRDCRILNERVFFFPRSLLLLPSLEYLRSAAGCRTVPVEVGSRYTDEEWSQTLLTLNDFIDRYIIKKVNIKDARASRSSSA